MKKLSVLILIISSLYVNAQDDHGKYVLESKGGRFVFGKADPLLPACMLDTQTGRLWVSAPGGMLPVMYKSLDGATLTPIPNNLETNAVYINTNLINKAYIH